MAKNVSKLLSVLLVAALALSLAVAAIWDQPAQALTADEITAAQTAAATELANAQARADKAWNALKGLPTPEEVKAGAALPTTCPLCGKKTTDSSKKLVWAVIEGEQATNISGTSGTYSGTSVHVFLTGDVTYNGESGSAFLTAPYNSGIMCVFTNGYNITSSKKPAYFGTTWKSNIIAWNRAGRNVPGSVIKGHATGDETGSTVIANPGSDYNEVHLFGGTYEKYDPASTANVIAQHGNAGKYYIYEGTTVNAGTKGSAVFLNGDMTYGRAQLNMYGGTINGGTGKAAVGVETSSQKAANASNKETFYCTFNMYAGTINGGAGQDAVKAIDESHANARGEKDCRINIYGGTINGNAADNSIAIRLGAARSDLKIYGGTINGKAGNCAGPAIRTEVASKITIAGGTINGSTTTSTGGAIFLGGGATMNINGGTITGGTAKAGGNIYLTGGSTATMTGGTISGGEARGDSAGGGNVYVYNAGTSFTMTGGRIENGIGVYDTDGETKLTNVYGPNIYVNAGTVNISGGTISGGRSNNATGGGSIYMTGAGDTSDTSGYAKLNISGNAVIENGVNEKGPGGNICAYRGLVTISGNAKIQGGDAKTNGGNIHLDKYSTLTIGDSVEISGGKAGVHGGNISIITNASLTMNGGTIKDGESTKLGGNIYAASDINATDGDILNGVAGTSGGNICITGCTVTLGDGVLVDNGYAKISGSSGNGGGNIYMRDGNPTLNTSATITNGKVDGKAAAGGNINLGSGCTLNVTGGLIANGKVLYDGDGSSWGGNIRSYGDKNTYINISGGTIYGGTSPQGATNVGIQYNENVTISGGEFLGGVTLSKSLTSLKLEGKLQFSRTKTIDKKTYYDYISIGNGTKADISQLDPESVIYVTASSGAAITLADENAANLRKCFITIDKNYCVTAKADNQLYYTKHTKTTITAKAAACEDVGYKVDALYCKTCKEYYNSDHTVRLAESDVVIPSLGGHQIVNHDAKAPTCTEIGWDAYETCARCDYTTYVEKAKLPHDYVGVELKAPTCTEAGEMAYTCSACGDSYNGATPATGHTMVLLSEKVEASGCVNFGKEAVYLCSVCQCYFADEEGKVQQDSDVPSMIFPEGHELTFVEASTATCEADGNIEHYLCSVCGNAYAENEAYVVETINPVIPMLGHSYTNYIYNNDATYEADGTETAACDNGCGTTDTRTAEGTKLAGFVQIGETRYENLEKAAAAAKAGDTIVLLADVNVAFVQIPADVTLDLSGYTVSGTVLGTLAINGGDLITAEGYKMIGANADYYKTEDAVIDMTATEIEIVSGTVTLAQSWWTTVGHTLTIGKDASFVIPEGIQMNVNGSTVIVEGAVVNNGAIRLMNGAVANGTVLGKLILENGDLITAEGYKMIGANADYYKTEDAVIDMTATEIEIVSGTVTLAQSWWTTVGHTLTIGKDASFVIPEGIQMNVNGSTVLVEGAVLNNGAIRLMNGAVANGTVLGKLILENGDLITAEGYKMIGANADYYKTSNAVINMTATEIEFVSGNVTLAQSWWTLPGQTITIGKAATFTIPEDIQMNVNGSTVKVEGAVVNNGAIRLMNGAVANGTVLGKLILENGDLITAEGYKMIGANADYYKTSNAVINMTATEIEIVSGTVTLAQSWWTAAGQTLTIGKDATFTIPAGMNLNVNGSAVIVEGTAIVDGSVTLYSKNATVKAAEGLNIVTNAGEMVWYNNGTYVVHDHSYTNYVYNNDATYNADGTKTAACDNGCDLTHTIVAEGTQMAGVVTIDGVNYGTVADALADAKPGSKLVMIGDSVETDAILVQVNGISIDLNGYNIFGTITVADGCTLYCFDSQTDDYTINDEAGYGKITKIVGNVQGLTVESADCYLMVTEADGVSFHRVSMKLTAMTLRASQAGVYYKSTIAGDEVVAEQVAQFGVALSVSGAPTAQDPGVMSWFEGFQAGSNNQNSTLLRGIMKGYLSQKSNAARAAMPIYGRAYILTKDGQYLFGATVSRSLQEQVEEVDAMWSTLTSQQQAEVAAMYQAYSDVMQNWALNNLQAALKPQVALLPGKEELAD